MIDTHRVHKHITSNTAYTIERVDMKLPHIYVMLAYSCSGARVPPFVIIPKLITLKPDISELMCSHDCWIISSADGWKTRETFFLWRVFFCHWIQQYRRDLRDAWMRESSILLIMDGHGFRGCPAALQLLKRFNIEVLILPSHSSHVLQMFYVGLAEVFRLRNF
jgi:hypothetical protein